MFRSLPRRIGWRRLWAGVLAACLAGADGSRAQSPEPVAPAAPDALRLGGFGTLGASRTSAPPGWGFQREASQPRNDGGVRFDTDSRLGLQANRAIDTRIELVGQLLLTRRLADAVPGDTVVGAFAAYRPTDSTTLRAGRISTRLYALSDYRNVGLAYPFVRPPTEFYGLVPSGFDGIDAARVWRDGADAVWKLYGFYGRGKQGGNRTATFRTVWPAYGLTVSREVQGLLVQVNVTSSRFSGEEARLAPLRAALQPVAALSVTDAAAVAAEATRLQRQLTLQGQGIDYFTFGINRDLNDWLWLLEASRADVHGVKHIDSAYTLLGRRFDRLTPYVALSAARTTADDRRPQWAAQLLPVVGAAAAARTQALGDMAHDAAVIGPSQRTVSIGLRLDASAQAALKIQFDRVRISQRGSLLWANGSDAAASAHVVSATLDFIF